MLFNSVEYILCFLPLTFTLYFILNKLKLHKSALLFLLIASLFFYGTYKTQYIYIILSSITFNYIISLTFKIEQLKNYKKLLLTLGITGNIILLAGFKYFNFLIETLKNTLHFPINTIEILIPLGISFFTIQQISYLIDCYKKDIKQYNLLNYSLFICFFPQFLAGPIVRHQEIIPQFQNPKNRIINQENIFRGLFLITIGLAKKVLIADNFTDFINTITNYSLYDNFALSWLFAFSKVAQGYFDFSGYCDIAMGSAFLFNIQLPLNFNSPFKATSIIDYWNRWHMTLVRFLKDYILTPLGGVSCDVLRSFRNVVVVSFTYGIWLGCNPSFIIYGLFNGVLICLNLLWNKLNLKINHFIAIISTFILVLLTTPFVAQSKLSAAFALFKSMLGIDTAFMNIKIKNFSLIFKNSSVYFDEVTRSNPLEFKIIFLLICIYIMFFSKNSFELAQKYVKSNNVLYTIILAITMTICTLSITRYQEFVYFNFQ